MICNRTSKLENIYACYRGHYIVSRCYNELLFLPPPLQPCWGGSVGGGGGIPSPREAPPQGGVHRGGASKPPAKLGPSAREARSFPPGPPSKKGGDAPPP
jgi:hypothetical protein